MLYKALDERHGTAGDYRQRMEPDVILAMRERPCEMAMRMAVAKKRSLYLSFPDDWFDDPPPGIAKDQGRPLQNGKRAGQCCMDSQGTRLPEYNNIAGQESFLPRRLTCPESCANIQSLKDGLVDSAVGFYHGRGVSAIAGDGRKKQRRFTGGDTLECATECDSGGT